MNIINHINAKISNLIVPIDAEKVIDKIQHPFVRKAINKMGIEWTFFNIVKALYHKPTENIILKR